MFSFLPSCPNPQHQLAPFLSLSIKSLPTQPVKLKQNAPGRCVFTWLFLMSERETSTRKLSSRSVAS